MAHWRDQFSPNRAASMSSPSRQLNTENGFELNPWKGKKIFPDGHYKEHVQFRHSSHVTLSTSFKNTFFGMAEVVDELKVHKDTPFMIHPVSPFISCWYIIASILLIYISITVPLFIAFDYNLPRSYIWMDVFIDTFFIVDIIVSFRTGYLPNPSRPDLVVMNAYDVSVVYMKTWFFIDLISSVPLVTLGTLISSIGDEALLQEQQLKLLKLTRVIRLIKLAKLSSSMGKFARTIDQAYVRLMVSYPIVVIILQLLNLFISAFFIVHYVACGWWMIGDMHDNSWSTQVGARDENAHRQYLYSLYWVVTTMTTVGYGDISATNDSERAFSIFAMVCVEIDPFYTLAQVFTTLLSPLFYLSFFKVLGCAFYGLLIAQITSIVAEYDANRRAIAERLDAISAYVHNKDFHPVLQKQILIYFRNFLRKHSTIDERQILTDMSSGLRRQCIGHLVSPAVANNPFFALLKDHITDLFHIMHLQVMDRGQHITRKGQPSSDLLVLMVGSAVILDESAESVRVGHGDPIYPLFEVKPGAVFGERCTLGLEECYSTTVRALSNCELYVLFADELLATLGNRTLDELRVRFADPSYRVRIRTYGIGNISNEDMPNLKQAIRELPLDPIKRTWSRRSAGQRYQPLRKRHPGRQTSTQDVLSASVMKMRQESLVSEKDENDETVRSLSYKVNHLTHSVNEMKQGLNQILAHLAHQQPIPTSSSSSSSTSSNIRRDIRKSDPGPISPLKKHASSDSNCDFEPLNPPPNSSKSWTFTNTMKNNPNYDASMMSQDTIIEAENESSSMSFEGSSRDSIPFQEKYTPTGLSLNVPVEEDKRTQYATQESDTSVHSFNLADEL